MSLEFDVFFIGNGEPLKAFIEERAEKDVRCQISQKLGIKESRQGAVHTNMATPLPDSTKLPKTVGIHIPSSKLSKFSFLHILAITWHCQTSTFCQPVGCELAFHCNFNLHFQWIVHLNIFCVFIGYLCCLFWVSCSVSSLFLCSFKIFFPYRSWILKFCQLYANQMCFPSLYLVF